MVKSVRAKRSGGEGGGGGTSFRNINSRHSQFHVCVYECLTAKRMFQPFLRTEDCKRLLQIIPALAFHPCLDSPGFDERRRGCYEQGFRRTTKIKCASVEHIEKLKTMHRLLPYCLRGTVR
jgi:hypothetical protein